MSTAGWYRNRPRTAFLSFAVGHTLVVVTASCMSMAVYFWKTSRKALKERARFCCSWHIEGESSMTQRTSSLAGLPRSRISCTWTW